MQNSEIVLYNLSKQAMKNEFQFDRLYRHLYNEDFYRKAYENLCENDATEGTTTGLTNLQLQTLIASIKDESYKPTSIRQSPKPLATRLFTDRLVQEVCRMLLEAVYEPQFSNNAHSFRPKRSCHTALVAVKETFSDANWLIEGEITGFFEQMNHQVLIRILRNRIRDEKLIRLLWKFLKAGFLEEWQFNKTYSGTPQGGIISPVLANIYLHELDAYVEKEWNAYFHIKRSDREENEANEKKILTLLQTNSVAYIRYANRFIIGVKGRKEQAKQLIHLMQNFLMEHLQLELSEEKTKPTHSTKFVRFLNYDISICRDFKKVKNKNGAVIERAEGEIQLNIPKGLIEKVLITNKMVKNIDAKQWEALYQPQLVGKSNRAILDIYNAELLGLYHYYALAENVSLKMWQLRYMMESSCLKTLAIKYKSSVAKMKKKFRLGKYWGVKYETKNGEETVYFYKDGFKKTSEVGQTTVDVLPNLYKKNEIQK